MTHMLPASSAGGGNATAELSEERTIRISTVLDKHLHHVFRSLADGSSSISRDQAVKFFRHIQHEDQPSSLVGELSANGIPSYDHFLRYVQSTDFTALSPPIPHDLTHPLPCYFISSSHNTYLSGNQLYSRCDADAYKNVLLRGCRCVEVDVWDGEKSPSPEKSLTPDLHRSRSSGIISRLRSRSRGHNDKLMNGITEGIAKVQAEADAMPLPWRSASDEVVEPQVMHAVAGQTLTKKITFRAVCQAIKESAFVTSDLPIIVSLEVHANKQQQQIMVDIMKELWRDHLVHENPGDLDRIGTKLPSPNQLRNKILVKVKYVKPKEDELKKASLATTRVRSHSTSQDEYSDNQNGSGTKPSKITESLGVLGVYTRSYKFKNLEQPEAKLPAHVFSVSENDVLELHNKHGAALSAHNRNFMMRVYPGGKRLGSSNLDPSILWRRGAQMVALNWQRCDEGMMLNEGMFAGEKGWVYKPAGYNDQNLPVKRYTLDLGVELLAAQDIPLPPEDKSDHGFHPYVTCELHVEKLEEREGRITEDSLHPPGGDQKRRSQPKKGVNPDFVNELMQFKNVPAVVPELTFIRFKIKDKEIGKDSLAAWACIRLDRLADGYRFLKLLDSTGRESSGLILVRITKSLRPEAVS